MFKISSTNRLVKNLSLNIAENDEVGSSGGSDRNKRIKRLPCTLNLNERIDYLNPDIKKVFTQLRQMFT